MSKKIMEHRTLTALGKMTALASVLILGLLLVSCGSAKETPHITVNDVKLDLSGSYEDTISAIYKEGLTPVNETKRKIVAEDAETLMPLDRNKRSGIVLATKKSNTSSKSDDADGMGYIAYGCKSGTDCSVGVPGGVGEDGTADVFSYEDAKSAGFVETGLYATKLYADGKEVSLDKYRQLAKDAYLVYESNMKESDFLCEQGYIESADEYGKYTAGYGLVRDIGWENYSAVRATLSLGVLQTLANLTSEDDAKALETLENENHRLYDIITLRLAAMDLGYKYQNGKIGSLFAVQVPLGENDYHYVNVAYMMK